MRTAPAVLLASFLCAGGASAQDAAAPPQPPAPTDAECAVFARELSFAQSVAAHDAQAFAEHVAAGAAFDAGGPAPLHGRDAITRAWAPIVAGKDLRLEWYPARTTVAGAGDLAWSTGPALIEQRAPGAKQRYLLGRFRSVWQREADGGWRVLFDDGAPPRPATEAEAAAFRAARPAGCPRG
ncbi:MAG TPA: nuclear transport factor 2 family protein [Xanthomonadaceae bacterium]|nr:nuclear transport factor 2 family protein [Xanthomonadaceae bacterium]